MKATRLSDLHVPTQTREFLEQVGERLGEDTCWLYGRKYHFLLDEQGWTLAVSEESGGRFRLETCALAQPVATLWAHPGDKARLAEVVAALGEDRGARVGA